MRATDEFLAVITERIDELGGFEKKVIQGRDPRLFLYKAGILVVIFSFEDASVRITVAESGGQFRDLQTLDLTDPKSIENLERSLGLLRDLLT